MASFTRFTNCHLIDNGQLYEYTDLYVNNKTNKISHPPADSSLITITVDVHGNILAPGFLDIQNNGIYGLNFSNLNANSTPQDVAAFDKFYKDAMTKYLSTGVTATCPTVTSNFPEVYEKVLPFYKKSRLSTQTDSLGAHIEGPFINLKKKGCHPVETFVDAKEGEAKLYHIYGESNLIDNVCILTAAPEIPGVLDLIPLVKSKNIVFSLGHTMADYKTGIRAVECGASMITHLYNAMPQPHHRDAGVVGLINSPELGEENTPYFGLIVDGVHVDPSMVNLAYRSNPDKCVLVTDAMHLIGLPDGTYKWDDQYIVKTGDRLYLKGTKTLAGAATTLPQCVRNLIKWSNITLPEAVKTVTNNAAVSVGLEHQKGFLNVGCDADLVVLDRDGYIQKVYKLGREIQSSDINLSNEKNPKVMAVL
ncbi:N-acetyl-glucosamine-6-phosphate deacetylase [Scheffersomyces stipitis CBS 6054]|uniref:N-acetylglucosamine-6-phosphate deacetylase n=1 Tax=Scheffersomyces stipitis (strain ATCC 58785 / CBS 6054 / NBRC 10063 / NRRL Y-11545) TaxID=322104 RepID=A3LWM6_PICST|nr:N-acetyl-glucosamine-6-phosphate deacetylase [Scheffersomyces stipitis CBS 6054]ABN67659.2 N-acetyl-glucosamine-6-phosphate deacetylase [Scheffersomyces stipitis CBS 6054]